jgi:hypothetical protein
MPDLQISLTEKQFKEMLSGYYAKDEHRHRMTQDELQKIAEKVNKEIDIPLLNEMKEGKILLKIILKIDRFLYDNLPNEIYDLIRSLDDGISENEAKLLVRRLAKLANQKINIPYIPEGLEYILFNFTIALVVNAMRNKWNIEKAINKISKKDIPENMEDNDKLENMILIE